MVRSRPLGGRNHAAGCGNCQAESDERSMLEEDSRGVYQQVFVDSEGLPCTKSRTKGKSRKLPVFYYVMGPHGIDEAPVLQKLSKQPRLTYRVGPDVEHNLDDDEWEMV